MAYGKFTDRAQKVIMLAQRESQYFKHGYIGTEHILLGIIEEKGVAKELLYNYKITYEAVKNMMEQYLGLGENIMAKGEILLTPRTKRMFDDSFEEAKKLNHNYVSPEHLLLALIKQEEGVAYTILSKLNLNFKELNRDLLNLLENQKDQQQDSITKGKASTEMLDKFSRDLTELAKREELDPVIGRKEENDRILEILCRRIKNNPCLIGEPGVGKTAVVEGLAQRIVDGNVPSILLNKRLVVLDISSMVAGSKYRGEFEDRLKKVMEEIKNDKNIIVFIDEFHTIIGAGGAEGAIDASNILKPALARGEIQCIGATTIDEYRKHIEKDSALERRFQPVMIDEPTKEETLEMLKGLRDKYEAHHRVKISDEGLNAAVELADRYINDRFMPDKAIDLIDEAASKIRIKNLITSPELKLLQKELEEITREKEEAIRMQNFEKAARLRDKEKETKEKFISKKEAWDNRNIGLSLEVDRESVAEVVSKWTKIPVEKLTEKEGERLLKLEKILNERVVGQEEAIEAVSKAVRRARVGIRDPKRPIGSFIFLGPTGVGKTELCKALAEAVFEDENNMIRLDMSEYMEKHSVSKLIGSPPGYVGYDEGGQLTEAVRRKPYSVILLDEIEKAHPDTFNILLQIMEDGRLTDGKGKVVDFKNTIIIMTSNLGAHNINKQKTMGFLSEESDENDYAKMKKNVLEELKNRYKPELLNRIDETIVFHKLNKKDMIAIVDLMLKNIINRLKENDINIEINPKCKEYLVDKGIDTDMGARPLRRTITRELEDKLSEEILSGNINFGQKVKVSVGKKGLIFKELVKK